MTNQKPRRTKTRSFGSSARTSHDASAFYNSRMYEKLPNSRKVPYEEAQIPKNILNKVINESSEHMTALPDNSVHLMVTSPPYNVGKEYDEDLTFKEYLTFLTQVWSEAHRVLVPGGRACINVANLGRKPYIPLASFITTGMLELGFLMRGEIIWNKSASAGSSTAWGSWRSASNPTFRDVHEYILVFSKDTFRRANPQERPNSIERDDFLELTKSIWEFPTESAKKVGHPAPFPVELPRRLIELLTFENEVVLDPFMGSGQTALAALGTGRHFVGYELNENYAQLAQERIAAARSRDT